MFKIDSVISCDEARQLSPVVLAFVGDAVYSLYVREKWVLAAPYLLNDLQKKTSAEVSAKGQSALLERILPRFTEEEKAIFLRGRNAKKSTKSKNASVADYNRSTGFEAVLGYLYMTGNRERIDALLSTEEHYED